MIFKALLNMDAFVNIGDPKIREIQQKLNRDYYRILFEPLGLIPCDGIYARSTNKALIYALQVEEGIPKPNGSFAPSTTSLCPTLSVGSTQTKFVSLLQYALYFNEYDPGRFDGVFDQGVKTAVTNFQKFTKLTANGAAGKQTWASLLVSTGDKNRKGTACDCITTIIPARAQTLKNNGYTTVGRYIVETSKLSKKIKEGELDTIFAAGLSVFPIFQYSANSLSYFSATQGAIDARRALVAANNYGFEPGTIIYFAVDYDAVDGEVTSHLLPHFQALHNKMEGLGGNTALVFMDQGMYVVTYLKQGMLLLALLAICLQELAEISGIILLQIGLSIKFPPLKLGQGMELSRLTTIFRQAGIWALKKCQFQHLFP
ncbi:hypothetical protein C1A50_4252 [Paenibacillus polymyxa]|nr:hypothetical protein C1A50_4252 [Paenibacillus polymyxa]